MRILPPATLPLAPALLATPPAYAGQPPDDGGLREALEPARRHQKTILLATGVCGIAAFLLTFLQVPMFRARALLYVHPPDERLAGVKDGTSGEWSDKPESYIQTQVEILKSASLLARVVDKLAIAPEPSARDLWLRRFGLAALAAPTHGTLDMATRGLAVSAAPQSRTVEVLFDATDAAYAAAFVNTLVTELAQQTAEMRRESTQATELWLLGQLKDEKAQLQRAEEALQEYARTWGMVATGDKDNVAEEKLKQLQAELSKVQAERVAKQSEFEIANSSPVESLSQVLQNRNLADYQAKIAELRRQLVELKSTLTPTNYKVQRVEAQLAEFQAALETERASVVRGIRVDRETAERRERLLAAAYAQQVKIVSDLAEKATRFNILKRELDTERVMYDSMLQKTKEAGIASALRTSTVHVIDPATRPAKPYKPNRLLALGVGSISGFLLGFVGVALYDATERRIRRPGEAPFVSGAPELAVLQYDRTVCAAVGSEAGAPGPRRSLASPTSGHLLPDVLRSTVGPTLLTEEAQRHTRIVVISSPGGGEGKTTVAVHLGLALASRTRRVLLVDANSRSPQLHQTFGIRSKYGFVDLLTAHHRVEDYPEQFLGFKTRHPGLYVLPHGGGTAPLSDLLYGTRLPAVLKRLGNLFDLVPIDTPPVLDMPEARVLGRFSDGVVLVVGAGKTTSDALKSAATRLTADGVPVLGTILNYGEPQDSRLRKVTWTRQGVNPEVA